MRLLSYYLKGSLTLDPIQMLLQKIGMTLELVSVGQEIPGSFWGDTEAGLIKNTLYARPDTPVHSILHEAGHYICMTAERRANLHTNAIGDTKGDFVEENATCYLQVLLSDLIPGFGREQCFSDMDAWGYSFRLGCTQAWFEQDAEDANEWLLHFGLIDSENNFLFKLRQ